jgi:hypothetical protein
VSSLLLVDAVAADIHTCGERENGWGVLPTIDQSYGVSHRRNQGVVTVRQFEFEILCADVLVMEQR